MAHTLVSFHAHPDDEAIATGGTIAQATAAGHRVVLVFGTRGELGEVLGEALAPGEELWQRRVAEAQAAAAILGVGRVEFLGYRDSGMAGTPDNDVAGSFWTADLDEAARRLATILEEERADVLTCYDERGGYEHPDHIQVHRVGVRAARLARTPRVYASTVDKEDVAQMLRRYREELGPESDLPDPDELDLGMPGELITTRVDVSDVIDRKRAAMAAHASQIPETSFFLTIPPHAFAEAFGTECYIRLDRTPEAPETSLFERLGG